MAEVPAKGDKAELEPGPESDTALAQVGTEHESGDDGGSGIAFEPTLTPSNEHTDRTPSDLGRGPRRLGRYELLYELGAGGMANVYLARTSGPGGFSKWFAVKRIHPFLAKKQDFVDMFFDEGRIAASLQHPNVSTVFELGSESGEHFLAMEYLHGESLDEVGRPSAEVEGPAPPLPLELAVWIVAQAARGLHHAHEARGPTGEPMSLVHRDISPHNIFIGFDGQVKITDFGIAKAAGRITKTRTGGIKGKFSYMAPEQALGGAVDRRVDIFALGVVLWELTTGRRLFLGDDDAKKVMEIASGAITRPTEVAADYPRELEDIVMKSLARRASKRYRTAALFAETLEGFLKERDSDAGATRLSGFMKTEHKEAFKARESLLHDAAAGRLSVPDSANGVGTNPTHDASQSTIRAKAGADAAGRSGGRRARLAGWAAALILVAGGVGLYVQRGGPDAAPVRVSSTPSGAMVSLDGVERGTTPLRLPEVASGRHRLELELVDHAPLDVSFDVGDRALDLEYRLSARAPPAAPTEEGPDEPAPLPSGEEAAEELPPGEDVVEANQRRAAEAAARQRQRAEAERAAAPAGMADEVEAPVAVTRPAYLNLTAVPSARATINGQPAGNTPLFRRQIPAGRVVVQLANPGGGPPRVLRFNAEPGETISRRVEFASE